MCPHLICHSPFICSIGVSCSAYNSFTFLYSRHSASCLTIAWINSMYYVIVAKSLANVISIFTSTTVDDNVKTKKFNFNVIVTRTTTSICVDSEQQGNRCTLDRIWMSQRFKPVFEMGYSLVNTHTRLHTHSFTLLIRRIVFISNWTFVSYTCQLAIERFQLRTKKKITRIS